MYWPIYLISTLGSFTHHVTLNFTGFTFPHPESIKHSVRENVGRFKLFKTRLLTSLPTITKMNPQELLSIAIFKTSFLHWPRPSLYYAVSSGLSEHLKVHTQPYQCPWCLILILPPLNFPVPIYLSSGILFSLPVPIAVFYCGAYKGLHDVWRINPRFYPGHLDQDSYSLLCPHLGKKCSGEELSLKVG